MSDQIQKNICMSFRLMYLKWPVYVEIYLRHSTLVNIKLCIKVKLLQVLL